MYNVVDEVVAILREVVGGGIITEELKDKARELYYSSRIAPVPWLFAIVASNTDNDEVARCAAREVLYLIAAELITAVDAVEKVGARQ